MRDLVSDARADEISDHELGRIIKTGTMIGLPLVFITSTALTLHVGLVNALTIAVLPTVFSGTFVGGIILLMRALGKIERNTAAVAAVEPLPVPVPSLRR